MEFREAPAVHRSNSPGTLPWNGEVRMGQHYGWMHDMMGWGGWMFPWGWILVLVLVAVIIYAVAGRGRLTTSGRYRPYARDEQVSEPPLEILKKRYAKGEISREEFEQMKRDIWE